MIDSIWRYPLKSAQGELVPRVCIGTDGPAGDRSWAGISTDGMIVSAKHPRRWGRMLYVRAVRMTASQGGGVIIYVPGSAPTSGGCGRTWSWPWTGSRPPATGSASART